MKKIVKGIIDIFFICFYGWGVITFMSLGEYFFAFWWGLCLLLGFLSFIFKKSELIRSVVLWGQICIICLLLIGITERIFFYLFNFDLYNFAPYVYFLHGLSNLDFVLIIFSTIFHPQRISQAEWQIFSVYPSLYLIGGIIGLIVYYCNIKRRGISESYSKRVDFLTGKEKRKRKTVDFL